MTRALWYDRFEKQLVNRTNRVTREKENWNSSEGLRWKKNDDQKVNGKDSPLPIEYSATGLSESLSLFLSRVKCLISFIYSARKSLGHNEVARFKRHRVVYCEQFYSNAKLPNYLVSLSIKRLDKIQ